LVFVRDIRYDGLKEQLMLENDIKSGLINSDMSFNQRVWALTARIPRGKIATYGDIARALNTKAFRAVGIALNRNPYAPEVPCHRVVGATGALTGFAGGIPKKRQMLLDEGVRFVGDNVDLCQRCSFGAD
jgi:methylated-DNA-[protein]-cysteine S-methyltransferase